MNVIASHRPYKISNWSTPQRSHTENSQNQNPIPHVEHKTWMMRG